jgi:3-hydroxyisobutyrate dehydrogenase
MVINVGIVGLGLMGLSIAKNLAKAGFNVSAYDVRPDVVQGIANLRQVATVADVGAASEIVFLSLPGPVEVTEVCTGTGGLVETMSKGRIIFDLSTNSVSAVKAINQTLAQKGIDFLDSPVSGGPWGAADGTLAIWIGGTEDAFKRGRPALDAIGKRISYMGEIGTGTVTKLAHNIAANIRTAMLGEILVLGSKAGITPTALLSAIRDGSHGQTRTFDHLGFKILDGDYDNPAFKLRLAKKDMVVGLELGAELGVPLDLTAQVMKTIAKAMDRGWGDRDSNVFVKIQQEEAGIDIAPIDKAVLKEIISKP